MRTNTFDNVFHRSTRALVDYVLNPRSSYYLLYPNTPTWPLLYSDSNRLLERIAFNNHTLIQRCTATPHNISRDNHDNLMNKNNNNNNNNNNKTSMKWNSSSLCRISTSLCHSIVLTVTSACIRNKLTHAIESQLSLPHGVSITAASLITLTVLYPVEKAYNRSVCIDRDPSLVVTVHSKASKQLLDDGYNDEDFQQGVIEGICSMLSKEKFSTLFRGFVPRFLAQFIRSLPLLASSTIPALLNPVVRTPFGQSTFFQSAVFATASILSYPLDTLSLIMQMERFPEVKYMFQTHCHQRQLLDNMEKKDFEKEEQKSSDEEHFEDNETLNSESKPLEDRNMMDMMRSMHHPKTTLSRGIGGHAIQTMLSLILSKTLNAYFDLDWEEHGTLYRMNRWWTGKREQQMRKAQELFVKGFNFVSQILVRLFFMKLPKVDSIPDDKIINNKYFTFANTRVREP